jgi:hypothetical protein
VSYQEIARGGATGTNYQILPGDRIFIAEAISVAPQPKPDDGASASPLGRTAREFSDKVARHPELLGVRSASNRDDNR